MAQLGQGQAFMSPGAFIAGEHHHGIAQLADMRLGSKINRAAGGTAKLGEVVMDRLKLERDGPALTLYDQLVVERVAVQGTAPSAWYPITVPLWPFAARLSGPEPRAVAASGTSAPSLTPNRDAAGRRPSLPWLTPL